MQPDLHVPPPSALSAGPARHRPANAGRSRRVLWLAGGAAALALGGSAATIAAAVHAGASGSSITAAVTLPGELEAAKRSCAGSSPFVTVEDGGRTLNIDGSGNDSAGVDYTSIACIVVAVHMPSAVVDQIDNTRALDGMQKASWNGFAATWNYHPDSGLSLVITQSR